jgi:ATP adenylyltransferase
MKVRILVEKGKTMKFLWAPWRMDYILEKGEKRQEGCIFCVKPLEKRDRENLILHRGTRGFVMMNRFPYINGHLMVIPRRHCVDIDELDENDVKGLFDLLRMTTRVLKETLQPQGFNIGINIGKAGGAGEEQLHIHIVPRWTGDTNFMPILGKTKVVPQYLDETYQTLHAGFRRLLKKRSVRKGGKRP